MSDPGAMAPFRSRRGRRMATVMAVVSVVLFLVLALLVAGPDAGGDWVVADRIMLGVIGIALAAALWRWAGVSAVPDAQGLTVRNLVGRRRLRWDEIDDVVFDEGDPWATLHLTDTETVAVMAIQRADGPEARAEAQRLARLIAATRA